MDIIYKTSATATGTMGAKVKSEDGIIDLEIRAPKEMGGPGGNYTNPEQLFAAGYASCFHSAINYVAFSKKLQLEPTVKATVDTASNGSGGFIFAVTLDIDIKGLKQDEAENVVKQASRICPFSNSTRGNIEVAVHVKAE